MPATSLNVTFVSVPSMRRARERPKPPSAFICPPAARRADPHEQRDEQDHRAEAEDQVQQEPAALVDRLGLDRDVVVLSRLDSASLVGERRDLGLEVLRRVLLAVGRVLDRLLELAADRLALGRDLGHVLLLDLVEERRVYGIVTDFSRPGAKIATLR